MLDLDDGQEVRGERLLIATGRRPRVDGIGLETVGVKPDSHGIPVDSHMQAGERLWAIGDITGIWPLTHVGEYRARSWHRTSSANLVRRTSKPSLG